MKSDGLKTCLHSVEGQKSMNSAYGNTASYPDYQRIQGDSSRISQNSSPSVIAVSVIGGRGWLTFLSPF